MIIAIVWMFVFMIKPVAQELSENIYLQVEKSDSNLPEDPKFVYTPTVTMNDLSTDIKKVDVSLIRNHPLGESVAKRLFLFENSYTYESEPAPGSFSGRKIVQKPVIYNSIYKIEKHFKKQIRKNNLNKRNAASELSRYLEIALILLHEETTQLENELNESESTARDMEILNTVEIRYN
jgi:hypothetical protein